MTRSRRRKIFYALAALFVVFGVSVVLYALGWRLDLSTLKISKVGGIYIRSFPPEAQIKLNNKEVSNGSGFLGNGTLISNLFPKTYDLKLAESGYKNWQEAVTVMPTLVVGLKYAVLVPDAPLTVNTSTFQDFGVYDSELALKNNGVWRFRNSRLGTGNIAGVTDDLNYFLLFDPETDTYYLRNVQTASLVNINALLQKDGLNIKKPFNAIIDPTNGKSLAISTSKRLYGLDIGTSVLGRTANATGASDFGKNIGISQFFWAWTEYNPTSNTSTAVIYDKFLEVERPATADLPSQNAAIRWIDNNRVGLLQINGGFYIYNVLDGTLKKVADDAVDFTFSSDGKMLAVLENSSVEIFSFDGSGSYYRFNLPNAGDIKRLIWYFDDYHLFVIYPNHVSFLDLYDTALRNFVTVAQTPHAEYDAVNNILYYLDNGLIKKLQFPR